MVKKSVNPLQVELWHERESNESLSDELVLLREENERLRKVLNRLFFVLDHGMDELSHGVFKELDSFKRVVSMFKQESERKVKK